MNFDRKLLTQALLAVLILLTAIPGFAQVPRAIYAEMGSATW